MTWKAQNIITSVFSLPLLIGAIIAYRFSSVNKVANVFKYILWILAFISNALGVIFNVIELYKSRKESHGGAFIGLIVSAIIQLLFAIGMLISVGL